MKVLSNLIVASTLVWSATAAAKHPDAALVIDNNFDGRVEVHVNGRYYGTVQGDAELVFPLASGRRDVLIRRPGGVVLLQRRLQVHRGTNHTVTVRPPQTTLFVANSGRTPLKVTADGAGAWVLPGMTADLRVTSGHVMVFAEVRDRTGSLVVDREKVWAEPGRSVQVRMDASKLVRLGPPHHVPTPVVIRPVQPLTVYHDHDPYWRRPGRRVQWSRTIAYR